MKVNEIFQSIDGEGIRTGSLVTFIRLVGCNLRCGYCDTRYAWDNSFDEHINSTEMTPKEIVAKVNDISIGNLVTITGGEPLIHKNIYDLIELLIQTGYEVNVETNGSIEPQRLSAPGVLFFTMDFKCPSSGEMSQMNMTALMSLGANDVLKFVVGSLKDLDAAREIINDLGTEATIFISPVFGQIEPKQIVEYMQKYMMFPCRVQLQLHKLIWDPNMRGV
jgi:7-carboxy-7-deazaguanine synthase